MSYIDKLDAKLDALFREAEDLSILKDQVLNLVQEECKESFKNGMQTARTKYPKGNNFKGKKS